MTIGAPIKLRPFHDVLARADSILARGEKGTTIYQRWQCEHCRADQVMDNPNIFFKTGICLKCHERTEIDRVGCDLIVLTQSPRQGR
jgi:hypothetical protein